MCIYIHIYEMKSPNQNFENVYNISHSDKVKKSKNINSIFCITLLFLRFIDLIPLIKDIYITILINFLKKLHNFIETSKLDLTQSL